MDYVIMLDWTRCHHRVTSHRGKNLISLFFLFYKVEDKILALKRPRGTNRLVGV